ncbi:DUF2515 family protein [Heyndrickxia sporothermodurans]
MALIVNEQNYLEKRVINNPVFKKTFSVQLSSKYKISFQ